ncbi:MAG: extracellular solute-binding protein [Actinomycetes bacterium]
MAQEPDADPIRFLGRDYVGFRNALARQARAWTAGNVHAEWMELPHLEADIFESGRCTDGSADLVLVVSDWMPSLIEDGHLLPLTGMLAAEPPQDWPDGWSPSMRDLLRGTNGQPYALAYHDGPMMTLLRRDLYDDESECAGFLQRFGYPLEAPTTWQQYLDQAQWFTRPEDGLWGTVLAGLPDGHNTVYDFLLHLWSRGGAVARDGQVTLNEAPGLAALTFMQDLWNRSGVMPPQARSMDSVASGQFFADGHAAMTVNWCGFAALSSLPGSPTRGLVRCAQVPGGGIEPDHDAVSMNVFWAIGVAAGSRDPGRAYDFLRHLASPEMDRITSEEGATGTRLSTWRNPEVRAIAPYYDVIEDVHRSVQSPPALRAWPQIGGVINEMVDRVIHQGCQAQPELDRTAARISQSGWLDD